MTETCSRPRCTRNREHKDLCREHRRMLQKMGLAGYIDATPAREKIAVLRGMGWSYQRIGRAVGVAHATLQRIGTGVSRRATAATVNAVAAIEVTDGQWVDSTGSKRRIHALVRIGWTYAEISRRCGVNHCTLRKVALRPRVNADTAAKVAQAYRELHLTPGPAGHAVAAARRRGFLPPLAWDEDTIDDPSAVPDLGAGVDSEVDEVLVERIVAGKVNVGPGRRVVVPPQDRLEAVRRMLPLGIAPTPMANRIGASKEVVERLIAQVQSEVAA